MSDTGVDALRRRALDLADHGAFNPWEEIGARLLEEGFPAAIETLENDASLRMILNARCARAQRK